MRGCRLESHRARAVSADTLHGRVRARGAASVGKWLAFVVVPYPLRTLGFGAAAFATIGLAWRKLAERAEAGGEGRTRTFEAIRRLIYSLLLLADIIDARKLLERRYSVRAGDYRR